MYYRYKFGRIRSNGTSVYVRKSAGKWALASASEGYSRSLEPTRMDQLPMTSYW